MKMYTYSQARERLAAILDEAKTEEVIIRRRNGDQFVIAHQSARDTSPLDVPPIRTRATTRDIVEAIREGRERGGPGRGDGRT